MRSSVSMVMRLPSRRRCTSLPSLTARRPNVVSAMSAWRQNSVIWLRIWSFFIGRGLGSTGGQDGMTGRVLPPSAQQGNAPAARRGMDRRSRLNPRSAGGNKAVSATRDRHSRGPDAPRDPDTHPARRRAVVGAFPRPVAQPARAALHHRHHAGRSADRRLQQDHRAESVFRREARDDLFLARGRLEQEGQLHAGDRGCRRGDPPAARASPLYNLRGSAYYDKGEYDIAIADFNDALRMGPPSGIIFHNRGNAWRAKGEYAKAIADYDSIDQGRSASRRFPGRTAASRNRRSAISTARWPTSTKRSGSTRHCRSR